MDEFYWGLFITILCLFYNIFGILLVYVIPSFQNKKKLYPISGVKVALYQRPMRKQFQAVKLPVLFWISVFISLGEIVYSLLLIVYPEILGFTLFTKAIQQPFFIRVSTSLILSINFVYLRQNYHFYDTYTQQKIVTEDINQKQLIKKLTIYIIDVIKAFYYGGTLIFGYLFLSFEALLTANYAGTQNSPTVTFIISAVVMAVFWFVHIYKAMVQHKYLSSTLIFN